MAVAVALAGMRYWAWLQESTSETPELYSTVPLVGCAGSKQGCGGTQGQERGKGSNVAHN